ncbi:MAG: hypothetical protein ACRDZ7_03195 [Acidimicrobiia bacterium]
MRTKGVFFAVLMALVGSFLGIGGPAEAESEMACKGEYSLVASPGLGSEPVSDVVFHTGGESGKLDCGSGGVGTIGIDGRLGTEQPVTCTSGGEGWGVFSYTYGGKTFKDTLTFDFGKISDGYLSGNFVGERYSGTFTSTPTEGDCVTAPATKADVKLDGIMTG